MTNTYFLKLIPNLSTKIHRKLSSALLLSVLMMFIINPLSAQEKKIKEKSKEKSKSKQKEESLVLYTNPSFTVYADKVVEGKLEASVQKNQLINAMQEHIRPFLEGNYPQLSSDVPLMDMMYTVALNDLEHCQVGDDHFRISPDFPPDDFFTRDIAYASMLGANFTHPAVIKKHLETTRKQRLELGFKCNQNHVIPFLGDRNEVVEGPLSEDFSNGPIAKRMDDVCWVIGYYDALCVEGTKEEFEWLVETFETFDEKFYQHFLDPSDGLYRGQSSFIDIGGTGYPKDFDGQKSTTIKALSTNGLYVGAYDALYKAYTYLGKEQQAEIYAKKRDALKAIIIKEFLHPDGYYAYFKYPDGSLEPRRENLGMAFLVLFDIIPEEKFSQAVSGFEQNDFGNPLLWPFYEKTKIYHNKAIWPFANTFYNLAEFRNEPSADNFAYTFSILARHALWGNFSEVLDYETGGKKYKHARSYIWSAAAYLAVIYKMMLGLSFDTPEQISFHPNVPNNFGGKVELKELKLGTTVLNISISGTGSTIDSFLVDGERQEKYTIRKDGGVHQVSIQLK